jgi:hypothetical protein
MLLSYKARITQGEQRKKPLTQAIKKPATGAGFGERNGDYDGLSAVENPQAAPQEQPMTPVTSQGANTDAAQPQQPAAAVHFYRHTGTALNGTVHLVLIDTGVYQHFADSLRPPVDVPENPQAAPQEQPMTPVTSQGANTDAAQPQQRRRC